MSNPAETRELHWRKARSSGATGCVELAALLDGGTAVRNSRHPMGAVLEFTREEMAAFIGGVREGEFDDRA